MMHFELPRVPMLIFTDLDGTLLDHHDYGFAPAKSALKLLREQAIPLIPNTSKTFHEMLVLQQQLDNHHPFITENGAVICIPNGYFSSLQDGDLLQGYRLLPQSLGYQQILNVLSGLRREHGFRFQGFNDCSAAQIANDTGLALAQAVHAKQRMGSEPILWQDNELAFTRFRRELQARGLHLIKGGRYWHVLSDANKLAAMNTLRELYQQFGLLRCTCVALGNSENDLAMLNGADIAVVIPNEDGSVLQLTTAKRVVVSEAGAAQGWRISIEKILADLSEENKLCNLSKYN